MEVVRASERVRFRARQLEVTRRRVDAAEKALRRNRDGIRDGVIRPIELQQAIGELTAARERALDAILDYNLAQFELLRAIGTPPRM